MPFIINELAALTTHCNDGYGRTQAVGIAQNASIGILSKSQMVAMSPSMPWSIGWAATAKSL